jgi:sigma-B regulation protein RsbU (phosphoserine phosphatase)
MAEPSATAHGQRPDPTQLSAALELLADVSAVVASTTELRPVLEVLVRRVTALLGADEGSIKVRGAEPSGPVHTMFRPIDDKRLAVGSWPPAITMSVMGYLLARRKPLATPDLIDDPEFSGLRGLETHVRAVLAVPLLVENQVTGFLAVTRREPGRHWTDSEIQLLGIVASNSAVMIEQARLRAEAEEKKRLQAENERMERDLVLAREIQMGLLPPGPLVAGPWDVHGRLEPARQVGGDYFDFYPVGDGRLAITIADVSGKGVPASLLMANLEATLRAYCDGVRPIPDALREVNRRVAATASSGKFISLFYAEIDPAAGRMRYANAGHNYPLLRRADGTVELLTAGGLLLGLFPDATYEMRDVAFGPRDAVLLYSDGISEAVDTRDREFGEDRLAELWRGMASVAAADAMSRLFLEVERFRGSAAQRDDMTAVIVAPRQD